VFFVYRIITGDNLTSLDKIVDSLNSDVDDLINKNRNMISEIDAIIKDLYDIHQEINQVEAACICVTVNKINSYINSTNIPL